MLGRVSHPPLSIRLCSSDPTRYWEKVDRRGPDECWPWTGGVDNGGYGRIGMGTDRGRRPVQAHRVGLLLAGRDPAGYFVDHVCHTRDTACVQGPACPHRRCQNPAHLELVSNRENIQRGVDRRLLCGNGLHPRTPENIGVNSASGASYCIPCNRTYQRERRARLHPPATTCPNGHDRIPENRDANGRCRLCARERNLRWWHKNH